MIAHLIHVLLASFYTNRGGIRHLLLAFYRRQQPGMPASWYGPYVRSLIFHYPHAMAACMHSLPHGSSAGCP